MLAAMSVLTGVVYPLAVTVIARPVLPAATTGSLLSRGGRTVGSALIGQSFSDPRYFWGRPSATTPQPYNAASSSGANLGPTNPALRVAVSDRVRALRLADPGNTAAIPVDLVTNSASGLDPHISPAAARFQLARIARLRGLSPSQVQDSIDAATEPRQWGVLGEPRVNVLRLNLALDDLK
jgi:K+-transporting ATPase ATPase C chain